MLKQNSWALSWRDGGGPFLSLWSVSPPESVVVILWGHFMRLVNRWFLMKPCFLNPPNHKPQKTFIVHPTNLSFTPWRMQEAWHIWIVHLVMVLKWLSILLTFHIILDFVCKCKWSNHFAWNWPFLSKRHCILSATTHGRYTVLRTVHLVIVPLAQAHHFAVHFLRAVGQSSVMLRRPVIHVM